MDAFIDSAAALLMDTIRAVLVNYSHNWLPLGLAMLTAAFMAVHVDASKFKEALLKRTKVSIVAAVGVGAFTPLCACGTMAVVIGMLSTTLPWGPVMAFLTSSPLMSPDGFILLSGIVGFEFAAAVALASVVVGLVSGYGTHLIERTTRFLDDQTKFAKNSCPALPATAAPAAACACGAVAASAPSLGGSAAPTSACVCSIPAAPGGGAAAALALPRPSAHSAIGAALAPLRLRAVGKELVDTGLKKILVSFTIFVALGYFIQSFVPTELIVALFNADKGLGVPLAALVGLPLYVTGDAAVPLIRTLIDSGASGGSMLAFMITGPATSAYVVAGISTFLKRRVVGLYLGWILGLGVALGYAYDLLLGLGL